jgi:FAD/FMN-containing dehydrogenase
VPVERLVAWGLNRLLARADAGSIDRAQKTAEHLIELADLFAASGAASFQIGKLYRYRASLDAATLASLDALKRQLDPRGLMNPGVLGFAAPTV